VTTPQVSNHKKHAFLQKPALGNFGRNELAILGAPCNIIQQLVQAIIKALPVYKIGFVDADHKEKEETTSPLPYISFTNKITHALVGFAQQPNVMQQRALFNDTDLVLVNGNHFNAVNQVVIISDVKPLHKKTDKLTNVQLVLMEDGQESLPAYLLEQVPSIKNAPVLSINNTTAIVQFVESLILQSAPVLNGLVLSGGESIRMGTDKGSIQYHGGKSQREHVYDLLKPLCNEVYVSCNAAQQSIIDDEELPFITDSFTGLGPVGGILSAFRYNPNAAWLVVACDLPYLTSNTLQHLIDNRDISKTATAFASEENNNWPEPLIAIWEPRSYGWLLQMMAQGYSCPRKALINADVAILQMQNITELHNVNEYNDYITTYKNLHAT
jgi:molybdopterin-guanine dinucleotide biosynthesis protein A